jgi:hypothetical protein
MSLPPDNRAPAAALLEDYERRIRGSFFGDLPDKLWFAQRDDIARMIAWPVIYLRRRGVSLPPERIRQILDEIILTVKRHGNTGAVRWFSKYFETVVTSHMNHHGEDYYDEAKRLQSMAFLTKMARPPSEQMSDDLARVAGLLQARRSGRKKARPAAPAQGELGL